MKEARARDSSGEALTWALVGVLALIVISLLTFEGPAQFTAILVASILGRG